MALEPNTTNDGRRERLYRLPRPGGMPPAVARGLAVSGTLLAATGIALGLLRYVLPSPDPFSVYPHPWWKALLVIHVFATPVFFFFFGSAWWRHVVRHWKGRERRASGAMVLGLTAVVAVSGYLLYFVGSERGIAVTRVIHTAGGVLATAVYIHHAVAGWSAVRARSRRF